ncbi:YfiT family bacillithiol transferase [Desertivirga brevis]|uniref:YfiT family bacillithiol transferase n=1 Tax=Desertivirga brevis TaxID=2810310 RepID=UPI001A96FE89|nr:putative metal-dependent hydrolase [Pedobacter sp. SYSU D00873]
MENVADINSLKFPIGPFEKKEKYTSDEIASLIAEIEEIPSLYKKTLEGLAEDDLIRSYRPGGWNIRQLVHHVADIQLLHYFRMKKAITETDYSDVTLINMDAWAQTTDSLAEPIEDSIQALEGLTKRYVFLMRSLTDRELDIEYFHPVRKVKFNQAQAIAISNWHLKHHLSHIKIAIGSL